MNFCPAKTQSSAKEKNGQQKTRTKTEFLKNFMNLSTAKSTAGTKKKQVPTYFRQNRLSQSEDLSIEPAKMRR